MKIQIPLLVFVGLYLSTSSAFFDFGISALSGSNIEARFGATKAAADTWRVNLEVGGFTGVYATVACTTNLVESCGTNANCTDELYPNSTVSYVFSCTCHDGYVAVPSLKTHTCSDIDECSGIVDCDVNADCNNYDGGYNCSCQKGFSGNGTYCINMLASLSATSVGQTYFTVQWNAIDEDSSYEVFYHVEGEENNTQTVETTAASIHIGDLLPGTVYMFKVVAVFSVGNISSVLGDQLTAPANITNILVSDITTSSVRVDWNPVYGATSYSVVLKNRGATVKQITLSENKTVFSGIDSGTYFTLHITASNDGGNSVEKIVQFSTALDKCGGVSCAANASCDRILNGKCVCNYGFFGDPDKYCEETALNTCFGTTQLRASTTCMSMTTGFPRDRISVVSVTKDTSICRLCGGSLVTEIGALDRCLVELQNNNTNRSTWTNEGFNNTDHVTDPLYVTLCSYEAHIAEILPESDYCMNLTGANCNENTSKILKHNTSCTTDGNFTFTLRKCSDLPGSASDSVSTMWVDHTSATAHHTAAVQTPTHQSFTDPPPQTTSGITATYRFEKLTQTIASQDPEVEEETTQMTPTSSDGVTTQETSRGVSVTRGITAISRIQKLTQRQDSEVEEDSTQVTPTSETINSITQRVTTADEDNHVTTTFLHTKENPTTLSSGLDKCEGVKCPANASCIHNTGYCKCDEGFVGDHDTYCVAYCSNEDLTKDGIHLSFNSTQIGMTTYSNKKCSEGRPMASAVCTTIFSPSGKFRSSFALESVAIVGCNVTLKSITSNLSSTSQLSADKLERSSTSLQVLTSGENLSQDDVNEVVQYMHAIKNLAEKNEDVVTKRVFEGIVNTADNLIESNSLPESVATSFPRTATADPKGSTTLPSKELRISDIEVKQKILKSLTVLAQQLVIPNGTNEIHIETKNMIIQVIDLPMSGDENDTNTLYAIWFAPKFLKESNSQTGSTGIVQKPLNISIPFNVLTNAGSQMKQDNNTKPLRLSFFLHKDATLFPSSDNVSMVIAATVGTGLELTNLKPEVEIEHNNHAYSQGKHNSPRPLFVFAVELKCVFWNFETASWSSEGCCLSDTTYPPTCKCNHLTNFAMVVSQTEVPADIFLDIVSDIGCVLSIFGLLFTIVVHLINKDIRKRRPTIILIHICLNLFLSYTFFLIGISLTKNPATCTAMAGLLHFLMLNAWTWMVIYTHDMYRSLVKIFNKASSKYLTKCTFFGYGVPFFIVVLNMAITVGYFDGQHESPPVCNKEDALPPTSAYNADNMCWLHKESLYFGFLLPVGLMLIFNIVMYILVIRSVVWKRGKVQSSAAKVTTKTNLMISITLASTTGLTWIIGYFMLLANEETFLRVMNWLFCIANTSQGLIIFLLTCFRNKDLRNIWWQPIRKRLPRSARILTMLSPRRQELDVMQLSAKNSEISAATNEPSTGLTKVKSGASEASVSAVSEANL